MKNSKNNVLKKVKVILRLKGKTYKATTNAKGKAVFKITKLNNIGKFTGLVKFSGNSYYKSITKKVKITVKKYVQQHLLLFFYFLICEYWIILKNSENIDTS